MLMTEFQRAQTAAVYNEAARIIDECGWVQGSMAVDKHGYSVDYGSPQACRFCTMGAVYRAAANLQGPSHEGINEDMRGSEYVKLLEMRNAPTLRDYSVPYWNDHLCTQGAAASAMLRDTAQRMQITETSDRVQF